MTQTLKNALALALLGGVALLGYLMFVQRDASNLILGENGPVSDQLLVQASSFVEKRMMIESLNIDTSILVDPRFVSLSTFTAPVPEQQVGKLSLFESAQELSTSQ
jgi:hypothetical protein